MSRPNRPSTDHGRWQAIKNYDTTWRERPANFWNVMMSQQHLMNTYILQSKWSATLKSLSIASHMRALNWYVGGYAYPNLSLALLLISTFDSSKQREADPFFFLMTTGEHRALIENAYLYAKIELKRRNSLNSSFATDVTTLSDKANKRAIARLVKEHEAKKRGEPPTLQDFLQHQATKAFCGQTAQKVGKANVKLTIEKNRLTVQMATIDTAFQVVVLQALLKRLPYHSNYLVASGHHGQHEMYNVARRQLCYR